jgi:hypothetical protein
MPRNSKQWEGSCLAGSKTSATTLWLATAWRGRVWRGSKHPLSPLRTRRTSHAHGGISCRSPFSGNQQTYSGPRRTRARTGQPGFPRCVVPDCITGPSQRGARQRAMLLTVKFRQPSHEFTFGVGVSFIPYPLVLPPLGITSSFVHVGFGV